MTDEPSHKQPAPSVLERIEAEMVERHGVAKLAKIAELLAQMNDILDDYPKPEIKIICPGDFFP